MLYWKIKTDSLKQICFLEIYQLDKSSLKSYGISDKWEWKRFHPPFLTARAARFHLNNGFRVAALTISSLRQAGGWPEWSSPSNRDRSCISPLLAVHINLSALAWFALTVFSALGRRWALNNLYFICTMKGMVECISGLSALWRIYSLCQIAVNPY